MEPYLVISNLNDFIFCPRSIYFHNLYGQYSTKTYHRSPQTKGLQAHKTIDTTSYSTKKHQYKSLKLYSHKYNLCGVLDLYDSSKKLIVERKRQINTIYDGYRYQLYAQYYCLIEMGHKVDKICLHSLIDNKRHFIDIPNQETQTEFEAVLSKIRNYDLWSDYQPNIEKCRQCIYSHLCDYSLVD